MKNDLQAEKSIAEIFVSADQTINLVDLYTGQTFLISPQPNAIQYSAGQIVHYGLKHDKPYDIAELASSTSAKALLYKIATKKKLTPFFAPAIQAEVEQILNHRGMDDPLLVDMENLAFCTIDGADTQDLDQALQVEKTTTGFIIRYAIADAAYYIKPESALFKEALKRGTSYYLPGVMIPMLPRELCVDVISLNENVSRRAVIFEIILDHHGHHTETNIIRAKIKSRGKLSFKEVGDFLDNPSKEIRNNADLSTSLQLFKQVGLLRLKLAEERNIARFHRAEINVKLGIDGLVFNLLDNIRNEVELYNEQFSLLCNIAGAKLLAENDDAITCLIQPIYKVHPAPDNKKLKAFEAAIKQLIHVHGLDLNHWQWNRQDSETLADYLKKLPQTGAENRVAQAIHRQALLMNTRSSFSEQPGRHYGVGANVYARFSAPMREIVGIFLHKELMEKVEGCKSTCSKEKDESIRQHIIQAANRAKGIQRQLTNDANLLVLDQIFTHEFETSEKERPVHCGTVIGLGRDKLYILLDDISIEIKLHIKPLVTLWKMPLAIDQEQLSLVNSKNQTPLVSLGDEVSISVIDKDQAKHRWIFSILNIV